MYRTAVAIVILLPCLLFSQSPADSPEPKGDQSRAEAEVRQLLKDVAERWNTRCQHEQDKIQR